MKTPAYSDTAAAGQGPASATVVSVYGRGNWIASELAARGWAVSLIDASADLDQ